MANIQITNGLLPEEVNSDLPHTNLPPSVKGKYIEMMHSLNYWNDLMGSLSWGGWILGGSSMLFASSRSSYDFTDGLICCFWFGAITHMLLRNPCTRLLLGAFIVHISVGYMPRSSTAGLQCLYGFNFSRCCRSAFQSGCRKLLPRLLFHVFLLPHPTVVHFSHFDGCVMVFSLFPWRLPYHNTINTLWFYSSFPCGPVQRSPLSYVY